MEQQRLHPEPPFLRFRQLPFHHVEIAIVDVHPPSLDRQPRSPVEDTATPTADLRHLALPAEGADVVRLEGAAVVDGQVPVAVRPVGALRPGATEGDGLDGREGGQAVGGGAWEDGGGQGGLGEAGVVREGGHGRSICRIVSGASYQ